VSGNDGKRFLLTPNGLLHQDPAHEDCNIDQVPRHRRQRFRTEEEARLAGMRRRCLHCWPATVANPDPETVSAGAASAEGAET
jgi:hypothetical protein